MGLRDYGCGEIHPKKIIKKSGKFDMAGIEALAI